MPKQTGLTDKTIAKGACNEDGSAKLPPYKMADRDRLFLLVTVAGTKRWGWAYRLHGEDKVLQLGRYPDVSIAQARAARAEAAKLVEKGESPESKKEKQARARADKATAFGLIVQEWIDATKAKWTPYYLKQVQSFLTRYVIDRPIGQKPIRSIKSPDIAEVLRGVATGKLRTKDEDGKPVERKQGSASVAILIKQWCNNVFAYAEADGRVDYNPIASMKVSTVITRPKVKHNRALSPAELELLYAKLATYRGSRTTKILIELLALTFVRTGELRQAQWSEFDLDAQRWTVPEARMKMKDRGDHIVPLSTQAVELLRELREINGVPLSGPDYLFPNTRRPGECYTATTANRLLENIGFNGKASEIKFSAHGFRGTASTLLHELEYRPDVIEVQLAHLETNAVKRAYNKALYLKERIVLMQAWGDYLAARKTPKPPATVIPFKSKSVANG
jgi:integrase